MNIDKDSLLLDDNSKEEKDKLTSYPIYDNNPYLSNLIIPKRNKTVTIGNSKDWSLINTETGEEKSTILAIKEKVDKEEFVKIYRSQIQSIFNLSVSGVKLFGYIMSELNINSDMIILDLKEACIYTGYKTRPPIYKAITELLEHKFIARTSKPNVFFINPAVFFNGKRFTLIRSYEIEMEKKRNEKIKLD
jgi:hypothetical protein